MEGQDSTQCLVHRHLPNIGGILAERFTYWPTWAALRTQLCLPPQHLPPPVPFISCLVVILSHLAHRSCLAKPPCLPRSPPLPAWQWRRPCTCPDFSLLPRSWGYSSLFLEYTSKSLTKWFSPSRKSSHTLLEKTRGLFATHFLRLLPEVRHVLVTCIVNKWGVEETCATSGWEPKEPVGDSPHFLYAHLTPATATSNTPDGGGARCRGGLHPLGPEGRRQRAGPPADPTWACDMGKK